MGGKTGSRQGSIVRMVRRVRRRWRLRAFLRGLSWTLAVGAVLLLLSAALLERARFSTQAVLWLRWLTWGGTALTVTFFLLRPLLRRVSDLQAALYLEEHEPSLEHAVASALESGGDEAFSAALRARLQESALDRARRIRFGDGVDRSGLYRMAGVLTAVTVAAVSVVLLGPSSLRHGLGALLVPTRDAASVNPYSIAVTPGDVTIARGSDQMLTARLGGFDAADASVFTRTDADAPFRRLSMLPSDDGGFEVLLLGVDVRTEYFVDATGVRSPTFTIDVADLPYVDRMDLTYHFPRYTGLRPRTVEDGGDVAALPGTVVEVRIRPTMATPAGRLVVEGSPGDSLTLADDGTLVGRFTVRKRGFYSVELQAADGALVNASPEYTVDVLTDQPPSIRFTKPGRDAPASPIEEVYLEVRADDDYGVGDVRIVYSVNGGPEDTVSIFRAGRSPLRELSTGHTLFLEEWELEPGDLVSYYGLVRDNRTRDAGEPASSDIYFLRIRPFERVYRQAEQQGGQPQAGGGQSPDAALSEIQRQIIAATFNLIRQGDSYSDEDFAENANSVALAQGRLKEQVETLVQRMQNRGLTESDPGFRDVSAILPRAAEAMARARNDLERARLKAALPHEQVALQHLQHAEETYERYVTDQNQQAAGGGGNQADAEDLADLFELELDKLKNQYETVQRGQRQQADDQVDEVMERLKELARRQQQEAERQRRRARAGQNPSGGGGAAQRDLAEETEEAARELKRLARETGDAALEESARRLEDAAEAMRRSAADPGSAGTSESARALERLEEARRRLKESRSDRARRDAQRALDQVDDLIHRQRAVENDVRDLPGDRQARSDAIRSLQERKDRMTEATRELERALDRAAQGARADQPEAARKLQEAADHIRESKLKEKLQYSRGTIQAYDPETALTLELTIEGDLQQVRDRLQEAREAGGARATDPLQEALGETRDLVRGMEALGRRLSPADTRPGDPGRGNLRPLSPEERRQARREISQRARQARRLGERLGEAGRPAEELQAVLDAMGRLEREGTWDSTAQVAGLQVAILESLKRLEFGLRRQVEGGNDRRAVLTGSDDVPEGYRALVEEYYRALARGGGTGRGR